MKKVRFLWRTVWILCVSIIVVIIMFFKQNNPDMEKKTEEYENVVKIMAPYTTHDQRNALNTVARKYEGSHAGTKIQIEYIPRENYKREIALRQDEQNMADIVICSSVQMQSLIKMGILKTYQVTGKMKRSTLTELWSSVMYNGNYYGKPLTSDPYILFYNKDAMDTKGLSVPSSWSSFMETAEKIAAKGSYGFGFAARDSEESARFFMLMLYAKQGNLYTIEQNAGISAFADLQYMKQKEILPPDIINLNQEDLANAFSRGEVRMMISQLSMEAVIRENKPSFEVGVAQLPGEKSDWTFDAGDDIGLTVNASAEANTFLNYLFEEKTYMGLCKGMQVIPAFGEDYQNDEEFYYEGKNSLMKDLKTENKDHAIVVNEAWFSIAEELAEGVNECLEGNTESPEIIAKNIQDAVRVSILER